jgi:hypothetical protein
VTGALPPEASTEACPMVRNMSITGAPGGNRTPDAALRTRSLYPLSYRGGRMVRVIIARASASAKSRRRFFWGTGTAGYDGGIAGELAAAWPEAAAAVG